MKEALCGFVNDIFETLNGTKKILRVAGVDEERYKNEGGRKIVEAIHKRNKNGIMTRLITHEDAKTFIEPREYYRLCAHQHFPSTPYYVYDNKYAIYLWGPPRKVVMIENQEIADSYAKQFDALWNISEALEN